MKRIKNSSINFTKLDVYNIKILCHHVEPTLFYLWLKYEAILFLLILFW